MVATVGEARCLVGARAGYGRGRMSRRFALGMAGAALLALGGGAVPALGQTVQVQGFTVKVAENGANTSALTAASVQTRDRSRLEIWQFRGDAGECVEIQ